jgi:hypothetical protein
MIANAKVTAILPSCAAAKRPAIERIEWPRDTLGMTVPQLDCAAIAVLPSRQMVNWIRESAQTPPKMPIGGKILPQKSTAAERNQISFVKLPQID